MDKLWATLADAIAAIKLLRGPILASIAAAVLLYQPDQIRELYRIASADRDLRQIAISLASLSVMSLAFWWVSFRIVQSLGYWHSIPTRPARALLAVLPGIIGALPLAALAYGMLASIPTITDANPDFTSPWAGFAEGVRDHIAGGLQSGFTVLIALAGAAVVVALLVHWVVVKVGGFSPSPTTRPNRGFFSLYGLVVSVAIVAAISAVVIVSPVAAPTAMGTLPMVAAFFVAIILMVGQMTFWNSETNMPFFMLLFLAALAFSALDWNDNHEVARLSDPAKMTSPKALGPDTWDSFKAWYDARPNRDQYEAAYPVYVVAAQGGGIYAAYHTATLLSRLQDRCPEFRNHLFAISSVSGGSLGAAVFTSITNALATQPGAPSAGGASSGSGFLPCPSIERAGLNRSITFVPGQHEQAANKMLGSDFLSPLVAGTLFPDFTQRFLPFAVPEFDRARWLERAFEQGWSETGIAGPNPFEESFLKTWSPQGSAPALLVNTTEADSGRRLVISPFVVGDLHGGMLLQFPLWSGWNIALGRRLCHGHEVSLSTAVGLSARFPWLTPAGTLTSDCTGIDIKKSRLVDGGYFDNSGVETALDVIEQIDSRLEDGRVVKGQGPRVEFHLIVLTTSEFPKRTSYGLGDALEPIRALLSTREARTPIAINSAERRLAALRSQQYPAGESETHMGRLHVARFVSPIYEIPLGWRISKASREIIDIQNGRFWDCDPDPNFEQQDTTNFSNADCIQMVVYHQLSETMAEALKLLRLADDWRKKSPPVRTPVQRFPHDKFMACHNASLRGASRLTAASDQQNQTGALAATRGLQRRQRDALEQVLRLWDANPQFSDDRWLAYMLAVVDYESGAVPFREGGCLTEKCALRTLQKQSDQLGGIGASALKREPNGNYYYGRGFLQLSRPENYRRVAEITGVPIYDNPDLLLAADAGARVLFAWMTDPRLSPSRTLDAYTKDGLFDLERAFSVHMTGRPSSDTPAFRRALAQLEVSNERFANCISAAKSPN
jgi:hypothetical protein